MGCPDYALGVTFTFYFNTQKSDGTPITLAGSPSLCARIDGNVTEITTGLTLSVDTDSKTGLHLVTVVATSGNGYSAGTHVSIQIAAGTVNGVSQVGVEVYEFTLEKQVAKLANAAHGGAAAVLTLERVVVASATTNQPAVKLTGNGSGAGLESNGGATGSGITAAAGATSGYGLFTQGSDNDAGIIAIGGPTGPGLEGIGGGTSGPGAVFSAQAGNSDGLSCTATGSGVDIRGDLTGNITGNLSGSVGSVTAGVTLADDAITSAKYDETTAFPLAAADTGATQVARTGADADTLETLSDQIDAAALETTAQSILTDTAEIGLAGAGLTEAGGTGDQLTAVPWNAAWDAEVQSEVQDAVEANHLDHLLAVTYDPAAKPGAADALLNELVENDGGVSRYTANALEQAPTGGSAPTAADIADAVWDEATLGHTTAGTFGEQAKTDIDAILADTNELQTDWVNGGRLDNILDARASQTSVDDVPTNAELATALAGADDDVLAAIAALNNLSQADVRTAVGLAGANLDTQLDALPTALENADALLKRDWSAVTGEATRSALNALRFLRSRWEISGGTLTVYKEDDATPAWTGAVTQTAGNPVSEIDPA